MGRLPDARRRAPRSRSGTATAPVGSSTATSTSREAGWAAWNIEYRRLGNGGGWPARFAGRYRLADPDERLPLGVPIRCVHGTDDSTVPISQSRS